MAPSKPKKKAAIKDLKPRKTTKIKGGVSGNATGRRAY